MLASSLHPPKSRPASVNSVTSVQECSSSNDPDPDSLDSSQTLALPIHDLTPNSNPYLTLNWAVNPNSLTLILTVVLT